MLLAARASKANAQTSFYKCKDKWGQPIFSQRPCGADAEVGTVSGHQNTGGPEADIPATSGTATNTPSAWEKSISSEMQVITEQYQSKIDAEHRKLDRFQEQADQLAGSF